MKVLYGTKVIANQYLNNDKNFEESFEDYKFEPFVLLMNEVYELNKKRFYKHLLTEELNRLDDKEQRLFDFVSSTINRYGKTDSNVYDKICDELKDDYILEKIKIHGIQR